MSSQNIPAKIYDFVKTFECLGAECEDTCCRGWGMQVDQERKKLYAKEAPELLDSITSGEADCIMRRDPETDYCVKFDNGLCGIHKKHGASFLGDACYLYPRSTRSFGGIKVMSATLSCPEIARKTLYDSNPFVLHDAEFDRIPSSLKEYMPEGADGESALKVIDALVNMVGDDSVSPERSMARLITIANSLARVDIKSWPDGINMLVNMADNRLPEAERNRNDSYLLLQFFAALIKSSAKTSRPRLEEVFLNMLTKLGAAIDNETLGIAVTQGRENALEEVKEQWNIKAKNEMEPVLRRWLQGQIAIAGFPYSGFGNNVMERVVILSVRFSFVRMALMCHMDSDGNPPSAEESVRIIQSISRFMDHLADPTFSISMYREAGWLRESRLRALVEYL